MYAVLLTPNKKCYIFRWFQITEFTCLQKTELRFIFPVTLWFDTGSNKLLCESPWPKLFFTLFLIAFCGHSSPTLIFSWPGGFPLRPTTFCTTYSTDVAQNQWNSLDWHRKKKKLSQLMRLWYLSHMQPVKYPSQSLRCSHTWRMEVDKGSDQTPDI